MNGYLFLKLVRKNACQMLSFQVSIYLVKRGNCSQAGLVFINNLCSYVRLYFPVIGTVLNFVFIQRSSELSIRRLSRNSKKKLEAA